MNNIFNINKYIIKKTQYECDGQALFALFLVGLAISIALVQAFVEGL